MEAESIIEPRGLEFVEIMEMENQETLEALEPYKIGKERSSPEDQRDMDSINEIGVLKPLR